jgi:hypothetical protein
MSSQPSIDIKPQPSQSLSDTTGVLRAHRSSGQSNRLEKPVSVGGLQIVQDQGKGALIDRDRLAKSRSQLRRPDSRQTTTVQPLAHSVKGAADSINASKGLLYNAIKLYAKDPERGLRARKLMGRTVILHSDLMDWLNRLPVKNAPSATHSERGHQRWAAARRRENSAE